MDKIESFIFNKSTFLLLQQLNDKERLKMYDFIFNYAFNGIVPDIPQNDINCYSLWYDSKQKIDIYIKKIKSKRGNPNFKKGKRNPYYATEETQGQALPCAELVPSCIVPEQATQCEKKQRNKIYKEYAQILKDNNVNGAYNYIMWQFIKHCALNKKMLTNYKLSNILYFLDNQYKTEKERIKAVEKAIQKGCFDVFRENEFTEDADLQNSTIKEIKEYKKAQRYVDNFLD